MTDRPLFQHRHYCKIAEIISDLPLEYRDNVAEWFAHRLSGTNAHFSTSRFEAAAKGQPINGRDK